ncbi:MAG TPA: sugar ABC transporter permease [Clostridiales bacterium]|nr:sugar ABC transporter permease [Clostridiales bacterium]
MALRKATKVNPGSRSVALKENSWKYDFNRNLVVYALFIPVAIYFIVFHYLPMFGLLMAFENFRVTKGVFGSEWVGLSNFVELFNGDTFIKVLRNTTAMALLNLTLGFAAPVIIAMLVTQINYVKFRRTIQTITYMPYFVSAVVVTTLASEFLSNQGALTMLLSLFGFEQQNWIANPNIPVFWLINTGIGIWQFSGYGAIIFIAAIANVNGDLYEAAAIDGAGRWKRLWRITVPSILPLLLVMLTLRVGTVFRIGFDKVLLLYMPSTYETADCLYTYTYRMAFGQTVNYGLATASGLFQSVISTVLLLVSNGLSKKYSKSSMF